jgi:hypothetical protein
MQRTHLPRLSLTVLIIAAAAAIAAAQPATSPVHLTQADLLRRIIDLDRLTTPPPAGERTGMFSSYDRASQLDAAGKQIGWDANNDWGQFIRHQDDGWDVMAEMTGPGAITRIWSANPQGAIRILLDDEPVIDLPFAELLSGRLEPFTEPLVYRGLNCYFPLGYAKSCKVLCRESRAYYQINYVQFAPGTTVDRFQMQLDEAAQAALAEVKQALTEGLSEKQVLGGRAMPVAEQKDLAPGDKLEWDLTGAGTVRALYVGLTDKVDPRELYALHRCVLRVYADGEKTPCVESPLIDFFGSGFDLIPFNSLPIGTKRGSELVSIPLPDRHAGEDRFLYCFFPMPFRNGLRVEIENLNEGKKPIGLLLHLRVDKRPPAADALRFHARFHKEDPCESYDYPILEATGRGRIVGCVLNVDCPRAIWWGEGDEKLWLDGEKFPSYFGTGSEDYISDAWGLHEHIRPLQGVTRTGPYGKNSAYRWHIPDCINFQKSVRFTIENWQFGKEKDTYYSTVAYWYADAAAKDTAKPLAKADLTVPGLRIPGAIEAEAVIIGTGWGNVVKQPKGGDYELSKEAAVIISTDQPVTMRLPSDADRVARLQLRVSTHRTFETITATAADGRTIGTVKYDLAAAGTYTVGVIKLTKGPNDITVQCPKPAVLDCWMLADLPRSNRGPEGEDLTIVDAGKAQHTLEYGTLDWSAGAQLALDFPAVGDTITFALPEQKTDLSVLVNPRVTCDSRGGRFQTLLDGQPLGEPFDTYAAEPTLKTLPTGTANLTAGPHQLAFRAVESNRAAKGHRLGLDVVELVRTFGRHAQEAETLKITGGDGDAHETQLIDGASAGTHLWCKPTATGAWIEVELPIATAGRYKLSAVYTRSWDYGLVQAYVNGKPAGEPADTYARQIEPGFVVPLGTFELPAGPARVKFEVTGKGPSSTGYYFGIDCLVAEPAGK